MDVLDAKGLFCPLPVIRTQDRIASMKEGERLQVLCTDPGTLHDVPAWCRIHGHHIVEASTDDDGVIQIIVEVGAAQAQ